MIGLFMFVLQLKNNVKNAVGDWYEINSAKKIISHHVISDWSACPKINPSEACVVLFPGESVLLTTVKLPKMRTSEQLNAVPFALEEQIASDPEAMQVAIGDRAADGSLTAALIEKNKFESTMQLLHDVELFPRAAIPDFLAIVWKPNTWTIVIQNNIALVRTAFQQGFSIDVDNLFLFLEIMLKKNQPNKPSAIVYYQDTVVMDVEQFKKLMIPLEIKSISSQSFLDIEGLLLKPALNLLQGKYRPKVESTQLRTNWLWCGTSIAALILFLLLSNAVEWFYFRHETTALQSQVAVIYRQLFPGATDILEPRFRVEKLLKSMESTSQGNLFFQLLGDAGESLQTSTTTIMVEQIQFDNQQLQLTIQATSMDSVTQYVQALQTKTLTVTQKILKTGVNNIQAEITVKA